MANRSSTLAENRHLYIVAGYPAAGKSSALWKSAHTGFPLFGNENGSVVPAADTLNGVNEASDAASKIKARFWFTLADLPYLNNRPVPPDQLIFHLDLLLAVIRYRTYGGAVTVTEMEALFARLFAEPALRAFRQCTVTTLHVSIEEVQKRWRHRFPGGITSKQSRTLASKDRLIMDERVAAPLFATIHLGWEKHLAALQRNGLLVGRYRARSTFDTSDLNPPADPAVATIRGRQSSALGNERAHRSRD